MQLGIQTSTEGWPVDADVLRVKQANGLIVLRAGWWAGHADQIVRLVGLGFRPLTICFTLAEVEALPEDVDAELGNEPDITSHGWTTVSYTSFVDSAIPIAERKRLRLWAGAVSGLHTRGLRFLDALPWDEWATDLVRCSVHCYPSPPSLIVATDASVARLKGIVKSRAIGCSEVGFNAVDFTQEQQIAGFTQAREFFQRHAFEWAVAYQLVDGPSEPSDSQEAKRLKSYGFMTFDQQWKPPIVSAWSGQPFTLPDGEPDEPDEPTRAVSFTVPVDIFEQGLSITGTLTVIHRCPTTPPTPPPPLERITINVLDAASQAIPQAKVALGEDVRDVSLKGRVVFDRYGPTLFHVSADGYQPKDPDLPPGEHNVHLERAAGPPPPGGLVGPLLMKGGIPHDAHGPFIPTFKHYGSAFTDWVHGKQTEVIENFDDVAAAGYHGIRPFTTVGYYDLDAAGNPGGWHERACTPVGYRSLSGRQIDPTPNYYEQKRAFLEALHVRGLRIMDDRGDLNAWSDDQKYEHMRQNGRLYASLGDAGKEVLAGLWAVNEAKHNGVNDPAVARRMLEAFKEGAGWWPDVRGFSDYDQSELPSMFRPWSAPPATVTTVHGNRVPNEHIIGHYFGYGYADMRALPYRWNTEPVGGGDGVSVGQVNDLEMLLGISAVARMTGQGWTQMSGRGVWGGRLRDTLGFSETPKVNQWLPADVATFGTVGHGGDTWRGTRIFATQFGVDVAHTRADYAIHQDKRFLVLVYKQAHQGVESLKCERAIAEYQAIDLVRNEPVADGALTAGQRLTLPTYHVCRLLIGRLA